MEDYSRSVSLSALPDYRISTEKYLKEVVSAFQNIRPYTEVSISDAAMDRYISASSSPGCCGAITEVTGAEMKVSNFYCHYCGRTLYYYPSADIIYCPFCGGYNEKNKEKEYDEETEIDTSDYDIVI